MSMRDHIPKRKPVPSTIGRAGRTSEVTVAKSLGARLRPNSGAIHGAKGDMITKQALIEAKSTTANSITIQYSWLGKISNEALGQQRYPALTVCFTDQRGKPVNFGEWILLPLGVYRELVDGV